VKNLAVQIPHKNQIGVNLFKDPCRSVIGDRKIECKFAGWVRQTIGKIVNVTKTSSEFEWQNPADMVVIPKVEFDAEQMLKHVLISADIKRWTHSVDRNNCCTTKAALIRTGPVNEVLDGYVLGNG
jgi:hypothetical protein